MDVRHAISNGTYPLPCSNPTAQNPQGGSLVAACVDGSVIVGVQPTPTDTPTNTPTPTGQTGGTPTITPTPQATNTSVVPPTPTRRLHFADSDSCQIIAAAESRPAWVLLLPAAVLLAARRRRR